jgi:hypothetical protein
VKITNFRCYERSGKSPLDWRFHAKVDVTEGALWWKRTSEREVQRTFAGDWFFFADGEPCPGLAVYYMERAANAKLAKPLA